MTNIWERLKESSLRASASVAAIRDEYTREEEFSKQNKPLEESLYKEFVRCNKDKKYLALEDVEALGVPYDILIVTSIKNTGKTVGVVYKVFNRCYEKGQKVMFLRTSRKEITESIHEYNLSPDNPFEFKNSKGQVTAFHKESGEECGVFKDFKFCNAGSGGEFKDYGAIVYDECLSWDPMNRLNTGHYLNWAALISSVTRSKERGVKVYCLGNLTGRNAGLLDFYGIQRDDNLRYITRAEPHNPENVCRILYINVNNIYKGISEQVGAVQGMSPEYKRQLYTNKTDLNSKRVMPTTEWEYLNPYFGFIIVASKATGGKEKILFEIRQTPFDKYNPHVPPIFCIRCQIWQPFLNTLGGPIYTHIKVIHNNSDNTTYTDSLDSVLNTLYEIVDADAAYYYDIVSQEFTINVLEHIKKAKIKLAII